MLYVVATPIGNLEDITLRALRILGEVSLIVAEDTRQTKKLLDRYEIKTPVMSFHEHSSEEKITHLVNRMSEGEDIALVSDAGTPAISDPGSKLVVATRQAGIQVIPLPGASAVTTLLSAAGLTETEFLFVGFLPKKKGRQTMWEDLAEMQMPIVIFESPNRVVKTLEEIYKYLGERRVIIGRELTKIHEEILDTNVIAAAEYFKTHSSKGEFVMIIS